MHDVKNLGSFSLSLTVKDLMVSKKFYENLGFEKFHGAVEEHWIIMKNGDCVIGLFQGMFEKNIMTFNPGWNQNAEEVNPFKDIRQIQADLEDKNVTFISKVEPNTEGPGSLMIEDPDGNTILLDQHR